MSCDVACDPKNRISCYTENNFNGDETIYKADTKSAPPGRNTCHSIDVDNGEWLVYTHDFYQGTTVLLKQDYYTDDASIRGNIRGNGTWDSQARSARPVRQHAITLFDKYFYCGATKTYRESNNDAQMQDCRSFIIRDGWWKLFPLGRYKGEYKFTNGIFGPGEYNLPNIVFRVRTRTATKQFYSFDPHMLDTPKAHVESFKGSLQYQGPVLWNSLAADQRKLTSTLAFRKKNRL
ncbi:PREDICTED: gamma-crystallin M1-1-like [Branchiostoma belcheri]|uniref:Gamma-crystallin M1-1-like n=1 Tax=Branchiostoma belcheri TaxID=7741 RepID=A0A6P4YFE9_BRABE|nr:PREDICTED: gamma-crystallin M1-1-like [Branchiostoma belcheri]